MGQLMFKHRPQASSTLSSTNQNKSEPCIWGLDSDEPHLGFDYTKTVRNPPTLKDSTNSNLGKDSHRATST